MSYSDLLNPNQSNIRLNALSYSATPLTTAQRLALSPPNGSMVYDTTEGAMYFYQDSVWRTFTPVIGPNTQGSGQYIATGNLVFPNTATTTLILGSTNINVVTQSGPISFDTNTGKIVFLYAGNYFINLNLSFEYTGAPSPGSIELVISINNETQGTVLDDYLYQREVIVNSQVVDIIDSCLIKVNAGDLVSVSISSPARPGPNSITFTANNNKLDVFSVPN